MKILPVGAEFCHAVRRTDGHDEANSHFFVNLRIVAKNKSIKIFRIVNSYKHGSTYTTGTLSTSFLKAIYLRQNPIKSSQFLKFCTLSVLISLVRAIMCGTHLLTIFINKWLFIHFHCSGPKSSDLSRNFQKLRTLKLIERGFFEHKLSMIGLHVCWWCCLICPSRCHGLLNYILINPKAG